MHNLFNQALAAAADVTPLPRSSTFDSLTAFLDRILSVALLFGGAATVLLIGYSALLFMTSGGDPGRLEKAKAVFKWTVLGYAIIVASWLIIITMASFFGVDIERP